jgi:leucyl aminopeptidase
MTEGKSLAVELAAGAVESHKADVLAAGIWKNQKELPATLKKVDEVLGGRIREALEAADFKAEPNETLPVYGPAGAPWRRVLLVGLGEAEGVGVDRVRQAAATVARRAQEGGAKTGVCVALGEDPAGLERGDWIQAQVEGAILGTYQFTEYRTKDLEKIRRMESWRLFLPGEADAGAEAAARCGRILAEGTNYVRWLAGLPGNRATPSFLAAEAERLCAERGYTCRVLGPEELEEMGMGALLGVARGSHEPCRLIVMEAKRSEEAPWVAVVGKGITFDSGGISLKPSGSMWEMKYDMCGGAAVLGLFHALEAVSTEANVVGVVPATENLPGGRATKPGDILKSYSGKTIEVLNTDAEGRLILADALSYVARNYEPKAIVDLATLTGACVVALGHYAAGLLTRDDDLARRLLEAGEKTGERLWRLPLWDEYREHLKSQFADIKNIGDSNAGAGTITAAAFLSEFVEDRPWAHLDIAGTAWWDKDRPCFPKGPTGFGVRLLAEFLKGWKA